MLLLGVLFIFSSLGCLNAANLTPPVWPDQFKAIMFQNRTDHLALTTLYYDWKLKANLNIIASQLGETVYDLEWDNGTSFIFTKSEPACKVLTFEVGILTPNWLNNATYLGQGVVDTFITNAWTKAEFIIYYADQATGRPVSWTFLSSNAEFHVLEWLEGTALPKKEWQAPAYCFTHPNGSSASSTALEHQALASGRMYRLRAAQRHDSPADQQREQLQGDPGPRWS